MYTVTIFHERHELRSCSGLVPQDMFFSFLCCCSSSEYFQFLKRLYTANVCICIQLQIIDYDTTCAKLSMTYVVEYNMMLLWTSIESQDDACCTNTSYIYANGNMTTPRRLLVTGERITYSNTYAHTYIRMVNHTSLLPNSSMHTFICHAHTQVPRTSQLTLFPQ